MKNVHTSDDTDNHTLFNPLNVINDFLLKQGIVYE